MNTAERFTLIFPKESANKPIVYTLIKNYDLKINILKAEIDISQKGNLLIDVEGSNEGIKKAISYLKEISVEIIPMEKQVGIDFDRCIHCGSCVAVCFAEAIKMNIDTAQIGFDSSKCIVCGFCIQACPIRIISVRFGDLYD